MRSRYDDTTMVTRTCYMLYVYERKRSTGHGNTKGPNPPFTRTDHPSSIYLLANRQSRTTTSQEQMQKQRPDIEGGRLKSVEGAQTTPICGSKWNEIPSRR